MSRKSTDFYCQCSLKRPDKEEYTISWIPAEFAIPNRLLSLKTNDVWSDWLVQSASSPIAAEIVEAGRDKYRDWFGTDWIRED